MVEIKYTLGDTGIMFIILIYLDTPRRAVEEVALTKLLHKVLITGIFRLRILMQNPH